MKSTLLVISSILLLLASSCGNYIYKHSSIRSPMMKEKNDINIQLNGSTVGTEIYGAYSPINYLALSAGYTWQKDTFGGIQRSRHDVEFSAIPYYASDIFRAEMPIGFAYFQQKDLSTGHITQPYTRMFFQPTIGASWDVFDIAFISRYTYIDYANPDYKADSRYEAGLLMRAGYKYGKAMLQFTFEDGTNNSQLVDYHVFHISLGLSAYFNVNDITGKDRK